MSLGSKASKLVTNKYFLYFILFITATNMLGYIVLNKLNAVIFFALIGLITYQFSKNMSVVLLVSLILTNLLMSNKSMREGLENPTSDTTTSTKNSDKKENKSKSTAEKKIPSKPVDINNVDLNSTIASGDTVTLPEPFDVASNNLSNKKNTKNGSGGRIDYASTLESAYDNLDSILGSDGIKNLTNDTQKLMAKQQELFKTMESMTPMLQQAKEMISGFDSKCLEGLAGLASSFTSSGLGGGAPAK